MKIKNILLILSLLIIFIIDLSFIFITHTSWNTSINKYIPLKYEITTLDKSITEAHLWLEEAIAGDASIDIENDVMIPFEHKRFLEYIKKAKNIFINKDEKDYLLQLYNLDTQLHSFYNLAKIRLENPDANRIGSDKDQEFDKKSIEISSIIEKLSQKIDLQISSELQNQSKYFIYIVTLFLIINIAAFTMLYLYTKREEQNTYELQESQEKALVTLRSIGDAVVTTDMYGNITFINTAAEKLTEYSNAEVIGLHIDKVLNLINIKTNTKIITPISAVLYDNLTKVVSNGTKLISKSGKEYIISDSAAPLKKQNGEIFGTVLIFQDDTKRHESEEALQMSEMRFRHLLETVPDLAVQGYSVDGTTLYWNKASEKIYGYTAAEAIGKSLFDLIIPPIMKEDVRQSMHDMYEKGLEIPSGELTLIKKDKSEIEVFSSHTMINIPRQEPQIFCIDLDISERKKSALREKSRNYIMELIASQAPLRKILTAIILSMEKQEPSMIGSILLLDTRGKDLVFGAAPSLPAFYNKATQKIPIAIGVGSCGTAAFSKKEVIVEDIQNHEYWTSFTDIASKANLASCWSTPIFSSDNKLLGTFAIYHHHTYTPNEEDKKLIKYKTSLASIAIEKNQVIVALETSKNRFKSLFENNPAGICVVDKNRNITTINQQFYNIMEYTSEEIIGKNASVLHVNDQSYLNFQNLFLEAKNHSKSNIEYQLKKKNGEIIWCELFGSNVEFYNENDAVLWSLIDITSRKKVEEKLRLSSTVFTHAREGIIITDANAKIIDVNDTFSLITGYSKEEAIGKNPRFLSSKRQKKELHQEMWDSLALKEHWSGEIQNKRKNGEIYSQMMTISSVIGDQGEIENYVSLFSDITLAKEHQLQLEHIAHYDSLTNLPNRVLLVDRLSQAIVKSKRNNNLVFVLYIDLDGFKAINDTYGHNVGDELLIEISKRMHHALRNEDTISRFGGDEFVAVLSDLENFKNCELILKRLLKSASKEVIIDGIVMSLSASIGVTTYPNDDTDADLLIRHADQAMYVAKQNGKNRYHIFDTVQDSALKVKQENLQDISKALSNEEFVLYYQPKVNMKTGEIIGVEALIRWQHPERGLVPPMEFLPVIENHNISIELGEWVINTALTQIENWQNEGLDIPISVNIGALQIQQSDFSSRLDRLLKAHPKVLPSYLELEILETSALSDIEDVSKTMNECKNLGVSFALDDFGTGYSSLTYMRYLPTSLIKIDQTFVRDILVDANDLAIVKGVIGLADAFKRDAIAEGVETIEHGTVLIEAGCILAQGYGIARPMPSSQIKQWTQTWKPDAAWKN